MERFCRKWGCFAIFCKIYLTSYGKSASMYSSMSMQSANFQKTKVVVTGIGCVSPCGNNVQSTWEAVCAGKSGIDKITLFDPEDYPVRVDGEVKNFSLDMYGVDHKVSRRMSRLQRFALASSIEAITDAGYSGSYAKATKGGEHATDGKPSIANERTCIISGVGIGLNDVIEENYKRLFTTSKGYNKLSPLSAPQSLNNEAASNVSIYFGIKGATLTISTACASGADAIGVAKGAIESGRYDVAVAIGCDANITPFCVASYGAIQALVPGYEDEPTKACQPFNKGRNGFVMAEGSATLILESAEHAQKRGARIYAAISGYGASSDANHITAPLLDGAGGAIALQKAISDAGVSLDAIQYYNAHGTSTAANDNAESAMLKTVFGENVHRLHISSTKSETGHMIGAAGAIEALFCVKAITSGFIPPTINLVDPDVEHGCDLDYTPLVGVECDIQNAATCSLGFGGHNAALIVSKWQ